MSACIDCSGCIKLLTVSCEFVLTVQDCIKVVRVSCRFLY